MMRFVMPPASARKNRGLAVFGEFYFDLVFYDLPRAPRMGEEVKTAHFATFPGGGLATTALVTAGLGTSTKVITRVGRDAPPSPAWQTLQRSGISIEACEVDPRLPTAMTICAAFDGDRMMITHDAINLRLEKLFVRRGVQRQIRAVRHLHLACGLRPPQAWGAAIRTLRNLGLTISADIGWNPEVLESPRLPALLKELDFLFPNELEARAITGEKTVEQALTKLARWVRVPVIKIGEGGSAAMHDGKIVRVKSMRVRTVDATGAGDAFNGGFLHGYLARWPLEACLRAGNICGALATTQPGGSSAIPTRKKLIELMKKIF
jgi:sugar/nucleoside kinase (ribokinase family)